MSCVAACDRDWKSAWRSGHSGAPRPVGPLDMRRLLDRLMLDFPADRVAALPRSQLIQEVAAVMPRVAGAAWQRCNPLEQRELAAGLVAALPAAAPPRLGRPAELRG